MKRFKKLRAAMEGTSGESSGLVKRTELTPLEQEFLPPVLEIQETPPSPLKRKVLWSIVLLVFTLITWSYFGRIQVASMASGKLIPDGKVKTIQPIETSVVRAIHVKEGQQVHKGELLIELDPTMNASELDAAKKHLAIATERDASARPLVDIGALSRADYLQMKKDLADAQDEVTKARKRLELESLRAPIDGVVQSVNVSTLGAVVTPAQPLVTIVPVGTSLTVEAMLSNNDVGFVKVGQSAEIKVDTFPFQKYGTIQGTLVWISPDAEDKSQSNNSDGHNNGDNQNMPTDMSLDPSATQYLYRVHIKPERFTIAVDGKEVPLTAGMTVKADITTDNRRVIEFFLSPVIKYLDEGLKVR